MEVVVKEEGYSDNIYEESDLYQPQTQRWESAGRGPGLGIASVASAFHRISGIEYQLPGKGVKGCLDGSHNSTIVGSLTVTQI